MSHLNLPFSDFSDVMRCNFSSSCYRCGRVSYRQRVRQPWLCQPGGLVPLWVQDRLHLQQYHQTVWRYSTNPSLSFCFSDNVLCTSAMNERIFRWVNWSEWRRKTWRETSGRSLVNSDSQIHSPPPAFFRYQRVQALPRTTLRPQVWEHRGVLPVQLHHWLQTVPRRQKLWR